MEYLQNETTTLRRDVNYPKLRVNGSGASLNVLAAALLSDDRIGAKFYSNNGRWYVQLVTNGANRDTFYVSKAEYSTRICGVAIGNRLIHGDYELIKVEHSDNEYQLVPID